MMNSLIGFYLHINIDQRT